MTKLTNQQMDAFNIEFACNEIKDIFTDYCTYYLQFYELVECLDSIEYNDEDFACYKVKPFERHEKLLLLQEKVTQIEKEVSRIIKRNPVEYVPHFKLTRYLFGVLPREQTIFDLMRDIDCLQYMIRKHITEIVVNNFEDPTVEHIKYLRRRQSQENQVKKFSKRLA